MMSNFKRVSNADQNVHFSRAAFGEVESSRMIARPEHITTFNAGDIVPIYCREVLPDESIDMSLDFVIRQTTLLTPSMGSMHVDICAYFVPNRIVNTSWKAVEGENFSGSWTANSVSLAPLKNTSSGTTQIPVGSVADYYGFPTQQPIANSVLAQCNDLKFRGYVMIYNNFFRDQNYQPPVPISFLNIYEGFLDSDDAAVPIGGSGIVSPSTVPDGSYGAGSVANQIYGSGGVSTTGVFSVSPAVGSGRFRALHKPFKANKLRDYFTSVLPSPQKGGEVFTPVSGSVGLPAQPVTTVSNFTLSGAHSPLIWRDAAGSNLGVSAYRLYALGNASSGTADNIGVSSPDSVTPNVRLFPANLSTTASSVNVQGLEVSLNDIRMASAIQQVYETLARGGSRYKEIVNSFFGIDVDNPYSDVPVCLCKLSRDLDLFQTAQTAASESGNTPQGNLAAFGYTSNGGSLFKHRFIEHGYLHVFAIVRHRNVYSSYLSRDNFRLNMLDFYTPPLANISEQPVYQREINPFSSTPDNAFGYQEAWAEYRFEPDQVSGLMRPGVSGSLSLWNYADDFDSGLQIANGTWLESNSEEVLNRTLAVTSEVAPQFKGHFRFIVDKTLPMPTYSVPGMDII